MLCELRVTWISRYSAPLTRSFLACASGRCSRLRTKLISGTP